MSPPANQSTPNAPRQREAWIEMLHEDRDDLDPVLQEQYEKVRELRGHVDNILKIHSLHPASLQAHYDFYKLVMYGRSPLTRAQREMIAVTVSAVNHCHY